MFEAETSTVLTQGLDTALMWITLTVNNTAGEVSAHTPGLYLVHIWVSHVSSPPCCLSPIDNAPADLLVSAAALFSPALLDIMLRFSQTPSPSPSSNSQSFLLLRGSLNTISQGDFSRPNISESSSRKGRETSLEMKWEDIESTGVLSSMYYGTAGGGEIQRNDIRKIKIDAVLEKMRFHPSVKALICI